MQTLGRVRAVPAVAAGRYLGRRSLGCRKLRRKVRAVFAQTQQVGGASNGEPARAAEQLNGPAGREGARDLDLAGVLGQHRLGPGAIADVAEVLGDLFIERGLQDPTKSKPAAAIEPSRDGSTTPSLVIAAVRCVRTRGLCLVRRRNPHRTAVGVNRAI